MANEKKKLPTGIREHGRGYQGRVTYRGKTHCVTGSTITETKKLMSDLKYKLEHGIYSTAPKLTLDVWFQTWIDEYRKNDLKKGSLDTYKQMYKYFKDDLGNMQLTAIRGEHIQRIFNKMLEEGKSVATIRLSAAALSACFRRAEKNGIIERNPVRQTDLPKKKEKREPRVLTAEEQKQFMEAAQDSYLYNLFALMLRTGTRIGEATGLKFSDIDYDKKVIHIQRTLKYMEKIGFFEDTPKTVTSRRDIPLTDEMIKIIADQKKFYRETCPKVVSIKTNDEYVFHTIDGEPLSTYRAQAEIDRVLNKVNSSGGHQIERFTPHCFRHCFATRCTEAGMPLQVLKTILGHSSLAMTADLYSHVLDDQRAKEMEKVANAF